MKLNDLILKVASFTPRQAIIFGGMISFSYFFLLFDNGAQIKEQIVSTRAALETERAKEKESDLALKEVDIVKSQLEHLAQQYQLLSGQLPRELSSSKIIRVIDQVSEASGVQIRSKEPKGTKVKESIEEFPILVKGEGTFVSVLNFIKTALKQEMILRIRSAQLMTEKDMLGTSLKFNMEISSFRFIDEDRGK